MTPLSTSDALDSLLDSLVKAAPVQEELDVYTASADFIRAVRTAHDGLWKTLDVHFKCSWKKGLKSKTYGVFHLVYKCGCGITAEKKARHECKHGMTIKKTIPLLVKHFNDLGLTNKEVPYKVKGSHSPNWNELQQVPFKAAHLSAYPANVYEKDKWFDRSEWDRGYFGIDNMTRSA